jgi:hypothetical protein
MNMSIRFAPIAWLLNSNVNSLTIQNVYVSTEFSFSYDTLLRGDWYSHKNYMGEDQNTLTHHGQVGDNVGTIWVLHPTNHYDHTNPIPVFTTTTSTS